MARRVIDGDTFETTVKGKKVKIRLHDVGAPERGEPGSQEATEKLRELLGTESIKFTKIEVDDYDRWVCDVTNADGENVNDAMREYLGDYFGN